MGQKETIIITKTSKIYMRIYTGTSEGYEIAQSQFYNYITAKVQVQSGYGSLSMLGARGGTSALRWGGRPNQGPHIFSISQKQSMNANIV